MSKHPNDCGSFNLISFLMILPIRGFYFAIIYNKFVGAASKFIHMYKFILVHM